jgi:hypothetical protein
MGYQTEKQILAHYTDLARKCRERERKGNERAKPESVRIARVVVILLAVILYVYFSLHSR